MKLEMYKSKNPSANKVIEELRDYLENRRIETLKPLLDKFDKDLKLFCKEHNIRISQCRVISNFNYKFDDKNITTVFTYKFEIIKLTFWQKLKYFFTRIIYASRTQKRIR